MGRSKARGHHGRLTPCARRIGRVPTPTCAAVAVHLAVGSKGVSLAAPAHMLPSHSTHPPSSLGCSVAIRLGLKQPVICFQLPRPRPVLTNGPFVNMFPGNEPWPLMGLVQYDLSPPGRSALPIDSRCLGRIKHCQSHTHMNAVNSRLIGPHGRAATHVVTLVINVDGERVLCPVGLASQAQETDGSSEEGELHGGRWSRARSVGLECGRGSPGSTEHYIGSPRSASAQRCTVCS